MAQIAIGGGQANQANKTYGIEVRATDIPLWLPEQAQAELNALVRQTLHLAMQHAAGHISDLAPVSEGILAQSFGADPANATGGLEVLGVDATAGLTGRVFSSLPYAIVMDQGRAKGQPISRVGIDAIGLWAQRKLGLSAQQAERAKWAIASHIVTHGFAGTKYFERGVAAASPGIEHMFNILGEQIAAALTTAAR